MNLKLPKMEINQFDIWLANLNPSKGSEAGKIRPVLVVQTNILNQERHLSTLICPITTNIIADIDLLRVTIHRENIRLEKDPAILIDQVRAIGNSRFLEKLGKISDRQQYEVKRRLEIIFDL